MDKFSKNNLFVCQAGVYFLLKGEIGKPAMLLDTNSNEIVICEMLEDNSWWHGNYYFNFDEAYKVWKEKYDETN